MEESKKKTTLVTRAKNKIDNAMANRGMTRKSRSLVFHYFNLLWEQLQAMLPITILQVLVLAIFFRKTTPTPALEAAGLISAVIGLVLFLEGLRVAIMPMAMLVGTKLPTRLKLPWVLLVAFALGVLVTYAEPAIAAIRPLAALVDPSSAPYLYYMMNQQQEIMVLAIGCGVGVAAVIGTLKFLYNISLKILIAVCLLPTVGAACYMQWGNPHLQPLLGVAWDCGGVTTGPVTVPVLLALGVGVMSAQKQKRAALAVLQDTAIKKSEGNSLEGFGIVTLASLLPVLAVELMAIITSFVHPYEFVLAQAKLAAQAASTAVVPLAESSPVKEFVYAVRAISPLIVALCLLVVVVLRQPLPAADFVADEEEDAECEDGKTADSSYGSGSECGDSSVRSQKFKDCSAHRGVGAKSDVEQGAEQVNTIPPAAAKPVRTSRRSSGGVHHMPSAPAHGHHHPSVAEAVVIAAGDDDADYYHIDLPSDAASLAETASVGGESNASAASRTATSCMAGLRKYSGLLAAMLMCQIGMILFNLGLTYGFAALGDMTGTTLPTAFLKVPYEPASPVYSFAGGVTLTMAALFLLGILATKAEPALNVLGETVETLSGGKFTKKALIWSVCFGVAAGMCAGACKILFRLPLIYFILVKYAIACGLTAIARESITAVAWDSAGVTTGPVTVPFVLAIGIGFSKAVGAPEGFGMLTVMSVAPIISVLLTSLMKQPVKKAATELARVSKISLQKMSRTLYAGSRGSNESSRVVDFAAQLQDNPDAAGRQQENSNRGEAALQRIGEH